LLEGKIVNLRIMEKEDFPKFAEWLNEPQFLGEYQGLRQTSRTETEKFLESPVEFKPFLARAPR
jgi:hypothetical protein